MTIRWRPLALALALVIPAIAIAQGVRPRARSPIATGFVPDPIEMQGHAHGARSLVDLAGHDCAGFVADQPSHVLALDTRFGFLRLFATSADTDLVLGVRTINASGHATWLCSDDRFDTAPGVEGVFPRGTAEVWVGTHTLGESGDYVLHLTETRSVRPGIGAGGASDDRSAAAELGLDPTAAGRYEDIHLRRGYLPDPRWLEGEAGLAVVPSGADAGPDVEPIEVTLLGNGCGGLVQASPAHVVTLLEDFDFLQLYLCDPADTAHCTPTHEPLSIVVLGPDGQFRCESADDSYTAFAAGPAEGGWPAGDYRVWVGVHHVDTHQRYRMGISELRRVD